MAEKTALIETNWGTGISSSAILFATGFIDQKRIAKNMNV